MDPSQQLRTGWSRHWPNANAITMCNGLFTSNRTLDQIYSLELKSLSEPIGSAAGGDDLVDRN